MKIKISLFIRIIKESLSFTYTANCKRQIQLRISQNRKINEQIKTILMDKKLRETTNLGVEIMNSKRQVKRKLGHVVQIRVCRLT